MKISDFINLFKNDSAGSPEKQPFLQPNRSFVPLNSPADNKTAVSFINSRFAGNNGSNGIDEKDGKNSDPVIYKVIVSFPKGKTELTYDQLEKAVIKSILQKNGINPSVAAVERLAERHTIDFTPKYDAEKRDYVFSEKNGLMMNVSDKKANRYDVPISASVEKAIIGDIELAKNITASGEKAFSELSMNERLEMVFDRAGKDLPQDVREALKMIDPKMLVGSMAIGAALSSLVSKGLIASEALVLVGGAVTMAQLISYMGDAEHILNQVAQAKKPEDLDVPAKQTAELIKSGAVDVFLTVAGYGVGKVAPKISKTATQFGDDATKIANRARAKGAEIIDDFNEGLQKLGKTLIPETELATLNGARFDPSELRARKTPLEKINDPIEARANENLSGVKKAVNLPSWDKLTFRVDPGETKPHFLTGHKAGEIRLETSNKMGGEKTVFPEWMTDEQIIASIKEAYQNSTKVKSTKYWDKGRVTTLEGYSDKFKIKVRIHINLDAKQIESAYPTN